MSSDEIEAILARVEATLRTAQLGFNDLTGADAARRDPGLRNLMVFGRSVTFVLQNLRGKAPGYDEWYEPERARMAADPLMRYFVQARNELEKQGKVNVGTTVFVNSFSTSDISKFPRPPGATAFFVGDQLGGSGWEVETADGHVEKYYVDVPEDLATVTQHFTDIPEAKAPGLANRTIEDLCGAYLAQLEELVSRARERFSPPPVKAVATAAKAVPYLKRVK